MTIYLIKPHPPAAVLRKKTPVPESYRYDWEPIALKLLADSLVSAFGGEVCVKIWHLMDPADDRKMLSQIRVDRPQVVFFTEIDVLVNETSRLADRVKKLLPGSLTVAGGKQSSLLSPGDAFPFRSIDYVVKGDGMTAAAEIIRAVRSGTDVKDVSGILYPGPSGRTAGKGNFPKWNDLHNPDGIRVRSLPVENHTHEEYYRKRVRFPSVLEGSVSTAAVLTGTGCPNRCYFCQSPMERKPVRQREVRSAADEIAWLYRTYGVRNFFSLEENLDLQNLDPLFRELGARGVEDINFSGFVRASDVVRTAESGLLEKLAAKGVRFLSIGLDVPPDTKEDVYNKSFSAETQDRCLEVCLEAGIAPLVTFIASPETTAGTLERQLGLLKKMPVASVDIRIAMALRNTPFFNKYRDCLIHDPDRDKRYYDEQNYRYQTIVLPGMIKPRETYRLIRDFYRDLATVPEHLDYLSLLVSRHPVFIPYVRREYAGVEGLKGCAGEKFVKLRELLSEGGAS